MSNCSHFDSDMNKRGLYIHVPFCLSKCPYCDFYSERYSRTLAESYKNAVLRNLSFYDDCFDTVYFGGGTPILLSSEICEILDNVHHVDNAEITVEANPNLCSEQRLVELLKSGVNRISIGIQSFNDNELAFLGRRHTAEQAIKAVNCSYLAGFRNISIDLMLGLEGQTKESVQRSVDILANLPITHVSAYLLKIEDGTPFAARSLELPSDDESADLYLFTAELLEQHGFIQYEISNFARDGYKSRHNLHYWHCDEYLGIGPAAHSYYNGKRFCTERNLDSFITSERQEITVTDSDAGSFEEYAMLALRLTEGLKFSDCSHLNENVNKIIERCKKIPVEYINITDSAVSLTRAGFLVSNIVIGKILGF